MKFKMAVTHNLIVPDLPRFLGPGSNVTVAVGRDAALTCKVDNLQTFKVRSTLNR